LKTGVRQLRDLLAPSSNGTSDGDGGKVPPGVYVYTLRAGPYAATKKLVVAR
jgi:hypothetical protein